jgi:hypothetical protein
MPVTVHALRSRPWRAGLDFACDLHIGKLHQHPRQWNDPAGGDAMLVPVAAYRQHPRDFFDVHGMFQSHGLRADTVECFVAYLAGHNRPVHEVLFSRDLEIGPAFENEFVGMERTAVTLADLKAARDRLRRELLAALTDAQKRFLLSLVAAEPDWTLLSVPHLAQLPAVQWKLQNLARLKKSNPAKFKAQADELVKRFG